jgi:transposase-like protein
MATKARRRFTAEFKREAVKLAEQPGRTVSAVARELGVGNHQVLPDPRRAVGLLAQGKLSRMRANRLALASSLI